MISKYAVERYLTATRNNSELAKKLDNEQLTRALARWAPGATFVTEPRRHQLISFLLAMKYPSYAIFLDMGLGKTKVTLDVFANRRRSGQVQRLLVVVPNAANVQGWIDQVAVHRPSLTTFGVGVTPGSREDGVLGDRDIVVLTYASFYRECCNTSVPSSNDDPRSGRYVPDPQKMMALANRFQMLVLDESQNIKNHQSLQFGCARYLSHLIPYRYALTGTPMGRDPEDLWSQMFYVDHGDTLGSTLALFRQAFCSKSNDPYTGFPVWTFRDTMRDDFNRILCSRSVRFTKEECLDLPEITYTKLTVTLPKSTWSYYSKALEQAQNARDGDHKLLASVFLNMRQIASGYLVLRSDDGGDAHVVFKNNPKLEALVEKLKELPSQEKAVVFFEYRYTGKLIREALQKAGWQTATIEGGSSGKSKILKRFDTDKKLRVLLVNTAAGGTGLNLQVANNAFFFETPVSPINRQQAVARIHRMGQDKPAFVYDLVAKATVDERVLRYLAEGLDLSQALIDHRVLT